MVSKERWWNKAEVVHPYWDWRLLPPWRQVVTYTQAKIHLFNTGSRQIVFLCHFILGQTYPSMFYTGPDCFESYQGREKLQLQNRESENQSAAVTAVDKHSTDTSEKPVNWQHVINQIHGLCGEILRNIPPPCDQHMPALWTLIIWCSGFLPFSSCSSAVNSTTETVRKDQPEPQCAQLCTIQLNLVLLIKSIGFV